MIWFSAESALIWTRSSACGPIAIPATRNTATSGILIFCASSAATVPIARIRPNASSVCLAISRETDVSKFATFRFPENALIQRPQPRADLAGGDIGLRQQLAHGEEAVELAAKMPVGHGNAGCLQTLGIFVAFVAQRIGTRGQNVGCRQPGERRRARRRGAPVAAVGRMVQIMSAKPFDHRMRQQDAGLGR